MKQKLLEMVQVTDLFHTDKFSFEGLSKTETGAKTAPRVPRIGYFDGGCQLQIYRSRVITGINSRIV